jgi:hypothetical protein
VLLHFDLEPSSIEADIDPTAGKRIGNGVLQCVGVTNLADGLKGSRQIRSIVAQDGSVRADLPTSGGSCRVCPKMIVEASGTHLLAQHQHLRRVSWIRAVRHHAVERGQTLRDDRPAAFLVPSFDERSAAIQKDRRRAKRVPAPNAFSFDLGIVSERSARRCWKAEIDCVAEVATGEPQSQADRVPAGDVLDRVFTFEHGSRERLRPSPQCRLQSAFAGERGNDATLGRFRHQTKRAIYIRLAASVRTRDEVQPIERDDEIAQGAVSGYRKCVEHQ